MNKLTTLSVVSTAETALNKLKKGGICVFSCKKRGAEFIFSVKDEDIKKTFAIFAKPCYNIRTVKKSGLRKLLNLAALRAGLIVGAALFVALAALSDFYILKIEVGGSGAYLSEEVRRIVLSEGAGEFKRFSAVNVSGATGKILALPQVTFCNIEHRGSILYIDVQVDGEHDFHSAAGDLISDCDGEVKSVVAVCGTAAVQAGDIVTRGTTLIFAKTIAGEEYIPVSAVGYCEILCRATAEYEADAESEENLALAYASLLTCPDPILERGYKVVPSEKGVTYIIDFTYLHRLSINLT